MEDETIGKEEVWSLFAMLTLTTEMDNEAKLPKAP